MPTRRSVRKRRSLAQIAGIMGKFEGSELSMADMARRAGDSSTGSRRESPALLPKLHEISPECFGIQSTTFDYFPLRISYI